MTLGDGKQACTLVFERYFFRTGGRGSLTIILENVSGPNKSDVFLQEAQKAC